MIQLLKHIDIDQRIYDYIATENLQIYDVPLRDTDIEDYIRIFDRTITVQEVKQQWISDVKQYEYTLPAHLYSLILDDAACKELGVKEIATAIVMESRPGVVTTPHVDQFYSILRNRPGLTKDNVLRLWIPITDSLFGHAFVVENEILHNWKAGDVFTFGNDEFHSAFNAGYETRRSIVVYCIR